MNFEPFLDELGEWLRIPSVSADEDHADDVRRAAEWVRDFVRRAGGTCELVERNGRPLAIGEIRAASEPEAAPTVLVYGHFDVQPPAPLDLWESPPFEPTVRDGWLHARGVADDKGQLYLLLKAAELLASERSLPVNVRIACDGEEEIGGHSIVDFVAEDSRGADAALIFDMPMLGPGKPALHIGTRGLIYVHLRVVTGGRDLHSGLYGGAALNAMHALMQTLSAVLPRDGRLPEPLRVGVAPPTAAEQDDWRSLPPGSRELAGQQGRPADADAADEFYVRTWAEPSLDVHGIAGGEPHLRKTIVPAEAEAHVSIRLAPGQDEKAVEAALERLLREAVPAGADLDVDVQASTAPGLVQPDTPAVQLAARVFEEAFARPPALVRSGGSLPIVPALAKRGIPTVLSGVALPDSNIHAPNERVPVDLLGVGLDVAIGLYRKFAGLGVS